MRSVLRQVIPSMFHRRLLLLAAVFGGLLLMLGLQTARITTGSQHEQRRDILRKALERPTLTPTSRGVIRDRKGRLLAEDRPGWDVLVSFRVLSGHWAYEQALAAARRDVGRTAWRAMSAAARDERARAFVQPYTLQTEQLRVVLAELGGVPLDQIEDRQRDVVAWVQKMAANATARRRDRQIRVLKRATDEADLSWAEVYVEVAEEYQSHAVLTDVAPETVSRIDRFVALAQREREARDAAVDRGETPSATEYDVWLEVTPQRVRQRAYPWESRTFAFDRSTLPGPLQSDTPIEITIDGISRHVIGTLRTINDSDRTWYERPFTVRPPEGEPYTDLAGYRPGDLIGRFGVERSYESVLRGTRGQRITHLDTGQTAVVRPAPGTDVHLTIDAQLQMRAQAVMSHDPRVGLMRSQPWHAAGDDPKAPKLGVPLNGAAVILDIDNGEVLAAVSVPGVSLEAIETGSRALFGDYDNRPTVFRPVQYRYEPGSTNKPLVLAAAITDGVVGPDEPIDCSQGHLWEQHPNRFREWIYRPRYGSQTFGTIDGVEAITVSSNVFFGKLAQRFGRQMSFGRVAWWFSQFGFGRRVDVGLFEEVAGELPGAGDPVSESDAAYMCIGEGRLSVTPLQVANAHATLARGGRFIAPTFVQARSRLRPQVVADLQLSPAARERALRGMQRSANFRGSSALERGTTYWVTLPDGSHAKTFNLPGVEVLAKSGTAEAPPLRRAFAGGETKPDGTTAEPGEYDPRGEVIRAGYHAWVVALVRPEGEAQPTHAVAVVVEYAGSGGRVAGPIVNQLLRALAAEGYLGDTARDAVLGGPTPTETTARRGDRP
ncbi:MAG: penicillin-binding transpeptidase domain-containing protein [Planctomycetota bacterium]